MRTNKKNYRNILLFVSFIAISFGSHGQGTIKTPKNQTINLIDNWDDSSTDLIATWEAQAASWIATYDSEADKKGPATSNYNCHAYAWHISDGGDDEDSWMNYQHYGNPNVSKYWTNDAYFNVGTIGEYTKIFYGTDADHSAISQSSSNLVVSKWGWWGLYEHALTDCPFNDGASFTYYSVPISGDDLICSSETYSTVNISGATYNWSGEKVSFNGTGYSESALKTGDGSGWVQCQISSPYSGTTVESARKNVWVGTPDDSHFYSMGIFQAPDDRICFDEYQLIVPVYIEGASEPDILEYDWDMGDLDDYVQQYWDGVIPGYPEITNEGVGVLVTDDYWNSTAVVKVRARNQCPGWSDYYQKTFTVDYCGGGYYMMMSPNPASEEVTLSIESTSPEETTLKSAATKSDFDENAEWELEVFDNMQSLKHKKTKIKGTKRTQINTQSWNEGIYVVRVKYKDQVLTGKLLVKK